MLGTDVNDDIANQVCAQLLYLEGEDPAADIWLYINSPGGSVTAGMAIYDTMQFVGCDVATVCLGLAASMGQFLLTAGAANKRYTLPNARIMMHQPLAGLRGQASDIAIQAEQLRYTKQRMAELIARAFGAARRADSGRLGANRWFTAEGARDYGLVDKVILRRGEIARRVTRQRKPAGCDFVESLPVQGWAREGRLHAATSTASSAARVEASGFQEPLKHPGRAEIIRAALAANGSLSYRPR